MDVLFISSKGSQYRYYQALSNATSYVSAVVTLFPGLGFKLFNSGLSCEIIKEGLDFHLKRKFRKSRSPAVLRGLYAYFSAFYFSLIYLKFRYYLQKNKPKIICIWNGHRLPEMAIKSAAKGLNINIAYFENGLIPNTTTMDFSGVNAFSSIPSDKSYYLEYAKGKTNTSLAGNTLQVRKPHKKKRLAAHKGVEDNLKYIFVPFQVNFDSQVIVNSPWINSMEEFYRILLHVVDQILDKDIVLVVKEHPSDSRIYSSFHGKHSRIKFSNDNTEDLIRNAQAIITLNSSVGIEAAMLEKKVVVLGDACYAIEGVTLKAGSDEEFIDAINLLPNWEPDLGVVRSFFNYLSEEYCLCGSWQKQIAKLEIRHLNAFESKVLVSLQAVSGK